MYYLYIATGFALLLSFIIDREKTFTAVRVAAKRFAAILPAFVGMLVCVSIVLFLIPDTLISHYLGKNNATIGVLFASFFGSITLIPGFIAFPLCGILLKKGVL